MGFKREPRTYLLVFDDPELEGLEVRARSLSVGELNDDETTLLENFANALVKWNLEDRDGNPLPATLETLNTYPDIDFINGLARAWIKAVAGVGDELGKDSDSGRPSLEGSIPMESLSPSRAS
jgi:hypothetical protein